MHSILVTGATGYIGSAVCDYLTSRGSRVIRAARVGRWVAGSVIVGDIEVFNGWKEILKGVDAIIHLAGRAHIVNDTTADPLENYRQVNTVATKNLAEAAVSAGVKRFVFVSSIGVNGNVTSDKPFTADDVPQPHSDYARSKYEAELELNGIASSSGLEVVIIRPPLVYGPNAPGNFGKLIRWLAAGHPLPLGSITMNRRSFVSLDNLVNLIEVCTKNPLAANHTFLAGDGIDLSTADFLCRLNNAMGRRAKLISVPPFMLRFIANSFGRNDLVRQLLDDLRVNIEHTRTTLGWTPPFSVDDSIKRAVIDFRK